MKWINTLTVGEYITAKQNASGTWYLTHPNEEGKTVTYSTEIKGKPAEVKRWIKASKVQDLVEIGIRTKLTATVINNLTNRKKKWEQILPEYRAYLTNMGRAPQTIDRNILLLERFLDEMKLRDTPPHMVEPSPVHEWVNYRTTCKLSSRRVMLQAIRSAWNFLVGYGYVDKNVAELTGIRHDKLTHAQKEPKVIEAFTKSEFNWLISAIEMEIDDIELRQYNRMNRDKSGGGREGSSARLESKLNRMKFFYSAVHLAFGIGLRKSDCALLEWDSIQTMPGWLIVHTEKTNSRIAIPYEDYTIKEFLKDVPEEERTTVKDALEDSQYYLKKGIGSIDQGSLVDYHFCFPMWAGEYLKNNAKISVYFKRLMDDHGMNGKSFHGLRHSRIRIWKRMGLSLEQIGKFVGHSSTRTTEGYLG
jgi:integrase